MPSSTILLILAAVVLQVLANYVPQLVEDDGLQMLLMLVLVFSAIMTALAACGTWFRWEYRQSIDQG